MNNMSELFHTVGDSVFRRVRGVYRAVIKRPVQNTLSVVAGSPIGAFTFLGYGAAGGWIAGNIVTEHFYLARTPSGALALGTSMVLGCLANAYFGTNVVAPLATVGSSIFRLAPMVREEGLNFREAILWVGRSVMFSERRHEIVAGPERVMSLASFLWAKPAADHSDLSFRGEMTLGFQNEISQAWLKIDPAFRDFLAKMDHRNVAGSTPRSIRPSSLFGVDRPIDPDDLREEDHISGAYWPTGRTAFLSQFHLSREIRQEQSAELTADEIIAGKWILHEKNGDTLRHEVYHAINHTIENLTSILMSDTPEFIEAYNKDVARMGGYEAARARGYTYFVRPNEVRGRDEVFAELGALIAGGSKRPEMANDWPSCFAYMQKFNVKFTAAYQEGSESFYRFVDRITRDVNANNLPSQKIENKRISWNWLEVLRQDAAYTTTDCERWANAVAPELIHSNLENIIIMRERPNDLAILKDALSLPEVQAVLAAEDGRQISLLQKAIQQENVDAALILADDSKSLNARAYPDIPIARYAVQGSQPVDWKQISVLQRAAVQLWDQVQRGRYMTSRTFKVLEAVIHRTSMENHKIGVQGIIGFADIPDITFQDLLEVCNRFAEMKRASSKQAFMPSALRK